MRAKPAFLRLPRRAVVVIVEPGFADCHHLWVPGESHEISCGYVGFFVRVVRMRADRAPDVVEALRDREQFLLLSDAGRNRDHSSDTGIAGPRHRGIEFFGEVREIEMAMAVDKHGVHSQDPGGGRLRRPTSSILQYVSGICSPYSSAGVRRRRDDVPSYLANVDRRTRFCRTRNPPASGRCRSGQACPFVAFAPILPARKSRGAPGLGCSLPVLPRLGRHAPCPVLGLPKLAGARDRPIRPTTLFSRFAP